MSQTISILINIAKKTDAIDFATPHQESGFRGFRLNRRNSRFQIRRANVALFQCAAIRNSGAERMRRKESDESQKAIIIDVGALDGARDFFVSVVPLLHL